MESSYDIPKLSCQQRNRREKKNILRGQVAIQTINYFESFQTAFELLENCHLSIVPNLFVSRTGDLHWIWLFIRLVSVIFHIYKRFIKFKAVIEEKMKDYERL